jgi:hypothetical protein
VGLTQTLGVVAGVLVVTTLVAGTVPADLTIGALALATAAPFIAFMPDPPVSRAPFRVAAPAR